MESKYIHILLSIIGIIIWLMTEIDSTRLQDRILIPSLILSLMLAFGTIGWILMEADEHDPYA